MFSNNKSWQNNNVKYFKKKFFIYVRRKDRKQQHSINIFIFQRQRIYLRSGKSTVKGKGKDHKSSILLQELCFAIAKPNFRYCTVYYLQGRNYWGKSRWKKKNAELKKTKLSNIIIFQIHIFLSNSKICQSKQKVAIFLVLLILGDSLGNTLKHFV